MAAVTQTINNYLGGVSRQTDKKKLPGQVRECLNAIPDPTFGLRKRPGLKFIKNIHTSSNPASPDFVDTKWFFIKRDDDEKYIANISNTGIRVWNPGDTSDPGVECTVHDKTYALTITANGTGSATTQRNLPVTNVSSSGTGMTVNVIAAGGVATHVYVCTQGTGYSAADTLKVAAADSTASGDIAFTLTTKPATHYLNTTRDNYSVLSIQDTTILTNTTRTVLAKAAPTYVANRGTVVIKFVRYSALYNLKIKIGSTVYDIGDQDGIAPVTALSIAAGGSGYANGSGVATTGGTGTGLKVNTTCTGDAVSSIAIHTAGTGYKVGDVVTVSGGGGNCTLTVTATGSIHPFLTQNDDSYESTDPTFEVLNAAEILTELKTRLTNFQTNVLSALSTPLTLTVEQFPGSLELTLKETSGGAAKAFTLTAEDNQGNANLMAFNNQIADVSKLPAEAEHGRKMNIVGGGNGYWYEFIAENTTKGPGHWQETVSPEVSLGLDAATLPHELRNTEKNVFYLQPGTWADRVIGDADTNKDPKFVGTTIQQAFHHNNRLGVLTEDNVEMSASGDFFNFFYTSALTGSDADPIGINCSSIRPAVLHSVIPTAQGLILFSKSQQFIMFADAEILTPSSAIIRGISNYEMDANIDPVDVGTQISFVSKTPSYTRVFSMSTRGSEESPIVDDVGKIISEWIPDTVTDLITSPQNQLIALYGDNSSPYVGSSTAYFFKTYSIGNQQMLKSWFKWDLPGNIQHMSIDTDTLWTVIEYSGKYIIGSASLTQTPEEKIIINSDGQQVNPHMDLYGAVSSRTYSSSDGFTKCFLPTGMRDNAALTPVLVITGNGTTNFEGVTESGFTITPDRPAGQTHATSSPYFEVPGKDLTNITAADIIVGYKYNYDIELPRTYFKLAPDGSVVDYTASLIISRMKFAVGLSSVCGFKLQSKGRNTPSETYTGVGTVISGTLVANGTGGGPEGDHTVENLTTSTNGSGTGMTVDVTMSGGVATAVTVNTEGTGYANGNTVTVAKALLNNTTHDVTATITTVGQTDFPFNLDYEDVTDLKVKVNGVANTGFSIVNDTDRNEKKLLQFTTPPGEGDTILLYTNNWYTIQPVQDANQYLADDVPLTEEAVFTLPIHQKSDNFNVRVFSNSPFPVSLSSMMWEGQYSPRFYRRT